jgi:predicted nucleic acid-binding protein
VAPIVDASVGLKWMLDEPDSALADALLDSGADLLVPDFWLHEATSVLWLQVRKGILTGNEAGNALLLLRALVPPISTGELHLHDTALDIGIAVSHSTCDTLYVAFALAMGAAALIVADQPLVRDMRRHPDPRLAGLVLPLEESAKDRGAW